MITYFRQSAVQFGLDTAVLYYDFPTYSDYETISHKPDAMLVSRRQGVVAVRFIDSSERDAAIQVIGEPHYDHILIDEGQDFPTAFYELCYALTKGVRDSKNIVWAYDELQNILDIKIRSPEELFGTDQDGQPRVSLDRSRAALPPGAENDAVLAKCYRNQREVLVSAHALSFGIYGDIVQLLESREHWQDVGYEVLTPGEFRVGESPSESARFYVANLQALLFFRVE